MLARMADDETLAARVTELEARFTLQQDQIEKLGEVLWTQQRELDGLGARLRALEARVATASEGGSEAEPPEEPPPHY
jgi:uncharacterized coiled-coil protein SlyX